MVTDLAPELGEGELAVWYEELAEKYADRMKMVVVKIKEELSSASWFSTKPFNPSSGEFSIVASRDPTHLFEREPDALDIEVNFHVCESDPHTHGGVRGGVAFQITIESFDGDRVGGFWPFELTEEQWVPIGDAGRVEARFKMLEQFEPFTLIKAINKWLKGKQA